MNTSSKTLLFAILLIIGVTGVVFLIKGGDEPPPMFVEEIETPEPVAEDPEALVSDSQDPEPAPTIERQVVDDNQSGVEYAQGAKGRLVDPGGNPLANTKVFLMEGTGNLVIQMQMVNKGTRLPPVARAVTDAGGNFALGVAKHDPQKRYEIRAISDRFVDKHIPNVHIANNEWYDAGNIQLKRGTLLYGRVTIEGSGGMPVPSARVLVKPMNFMPALSPTPGREDGIVVEADHTGGFRMENAPPGVITIAAVAPGYAKVERTNVTITKNGDNQQLFELPPGVSIAGTVTNRAKQPVANAKIQVTSISTKTPVMVVTRSDEQGHFEAIGLVQGHYMLTAVAPGYVAPKPIKPIEAGKQDVVVELDSLVSARLRVFDKNNRLLTRYTVTVKTYFKAQDQISTSMMPSKSARPDREGIYTVDGLEPAPKEYVLQVDAKGHAKAFSQPFKIPLRAEAPLLEVRLNEGGIIEGIVQDSRGQPLPGVIVKTLPNHLDDNPFTTIFGGMIPYRVTRTEVKTDKKGFYRVKMLNDGKYQLRYIHPEHYQVSVKNQMVVAGQTTTAKPMRLQRGTVVSGEVRVDGKLAGQVKVTITAMNPPGAKFSSPTLFSCDAITGNKGGFTMSKRVPPGRYQVMAGRQTLPNPLLVIADFNKTKKEISLAQGQEKYFLPINIASQ